MTNPKGDQMTTSPIYQWTFDTREILPCKEVAGCLTSDLPPSSSTEYKIRNISAQNEDEGKGYEIYSLADELEYDCVDEHKTPENNWNGRVICGSTGWDTKQVPSCSKGTGTWSPWGPCYNDNDAKGQSCGHGRKMRVCLAPDGKTRVSGDDCPDDGGEQEQKCDTGKKCVTCPDTGAVTDDRSTCCHSDIGFKLSDDDTTCVPNGICGCKHPQTISTQRTPYECFAYGSKDLYSEPNLSTYDGSGKTVCRDWPETLDTKEKCESFRTDSNYPGADNKHVKNHQWCQWTPDTSSKS